MHTRPSCERRGRARARDGERGSASAQLVLLTPVLVLFLLFFLGIGRLTHARALVGDAAAQAARAATENYLNPGQATAAADQNAAAALASSGLSCASDQVTVDTGDDHPGGSITVTLACHVDLSQAVAAGFPGAVTITSTFTSPVDVYVPTSGSGS